LAGSPHPLHGDRLSEAEYERRVVALHAGLPPNPPKECQRELRRAELDLAIDHRLGRDFPLPRRRDLWEIQERVERRRKRLVFRLLLDIVRTGSLERGANRLARDTVAAYGRVLTPGELDAFFGEAEARDPRLPARADVAPPGGSD
jgi:hypothetical protein